MDNMVFKVKKLIQVKTNRQQLRNSGLKEETESFIAAAQDQSLSIRNYQANVLQNGTDPKMQTLHTCLMKQQTISFWCIMVDKSSCFSEYIKVISLLPTRD